MRNPWIIYTVSRLALFFGVFIALALLGFNPFFAAIIAAIVSFALSLILLDGQRKAMSEKMHSTFSSKKDDDSDYENQMLDESETNEADSDGHGDSPRN